MYKQEQSRFWITTNICIVLGVLALFYISIIISANNSIIEISAERVPLVSAGITLLGVLIALLSITITVSRHNKTTAYNNKILEHNLAVFDATRRMEAMKAVDKFIENNLQASIKEKYPENFKKITPLTIEETKKIFNASRENLLCEKQDISRYLNGFESLAIGVNQSIYDEEVIKTALYGPMQNSVKIFSNYIDLTKKTTQNSYSELINLVRRWEAN